MDIHAELECDAEFAFVAAGKTWFSNSTYGGESALALGANWYVGDRVLLNAHVARSTGSGAGTGASVGATIGF
ncbi:MAG TPA: YadA C-terminal domain-containing protein [Paraburkholderia sp.]|nr:YadA C-terminal domain-containing protein [Paraburkholderia sp.]